MQEHVKLEVSLEIIMAKIAEEIFSFDTNKSEIRLKELMELQENAYKGDKEAINKILEM